MNSLEALGQAIEANPRISRRFFGRVVLATIVGASLFETACTLEASPKQVARGYVEALMAGDSNRALELLDPATRHFLQNDPKNKVAFPRFVQDFKVNCGNSPIKDVVVIQEIQQPVAVARVEILLRTSCNVPYYSPSYALDSPLGITRLKQSSISFALRKVEGRWYPTLQ